MTAVDPIEYDLIDSGDPRFVRPSGDRRERPVPCAECLTPTLAILGPLCPRCQNRGVCGHDYGDDPHDAPDGTVVCPDCCPTCEPSSTPTAIGVDAAAGVPSPPSVGSAQDAAPVAAPLADKE